MGEKLGERGHEFGTVTGRKRRCGWFDSVLVRQVAKVSGIDGIALTKLDVLDGFDTIRICVGYMLDGERLDRLPASTGAQAHIVPVYEDFEGWSESTQGARRWADLPAQAVKYVRRVEELIECPVTLLSTSPERDDTILMKDPFLGMTCGGRGLFLSVSGRSSSRTAPMEEIAMFVVIVPSHPYP